jgi:hypothetical protein
MTIRIPGDNILDKILKLFGKERRVIIPAEADKIHRKYGPYVQIKAKKESFFKVLFGQTQKQKKEN